MENTLPFPLEPPPGQAKGKKRWNGRPGRRTKKNHREVKKLEELHQQVNQLEEKIKALTIEQMEQDKAHTKELENCEKERKTELANFHQIYATKMKRQEQKYVVEVTKVVEAMKELKDRMNEIKEDRDSYKSSREIYKTCLEEEREDRKRQDDAHAQHMDMMQNSILVVAQTLKEQELQHAKEIKELWKTHADQAKLSDKECKTMTTNISTLKEKQQENITNQQENRKKPQENHQTTMKSSETYTVVTPVTIRKQSKTFDESQVKTPFKKQKPTTKKKQLKKHEKQGKQEKYKTDTESQSKLPCTKVHHKTKIETKTETKNETKNEKKNKTHG